MIELETYEFEYNMFIAESELYNKMICIGSDYVNESAGLMILQESMKDTIMNYLHKIAQSTQKAWERFKEITLQAANTAYLKSVEKRINAIEDPGFTIEGFIEYDLFKLNTVQVIQFDYQNMKSSLETIDAYKQKFYSNIASTQGSNTQEQIKNMCFRKKSNIECTKDFLQTRYNFICNEYPNYIKTIEDNLKTLNTSNANIERLVSTVQPADITQEAVSLYNTYITEADNDTPATPQPAPTSANTTNKDTKEGVKFKDDPNREKKATNSQLVKDITVYMKASTDVLTAKMRIFKDIYRQDLKIIRHAVGSPKKEEPDSNPANQTNPNRIQI